MSWPSPIFRIPEPETAKVLARRGHPVMAFMLVLAWILSVPIGTMLLIVAYALIHG